LSERLTYEGWNETKVKDILNIHRDYYDVLKWAYQEYGKEIVYACSFGAEGIVLIDLIAKIEQDAKIVFLDTGLHFPETYELIEEIKLRYPNFQIDCVRPKISLEEQAKWYGDELWKDHPNLCCYLRKIMPLQEALSGAKAWISGLRREQSLSRSKTEYINKDEKFKKVKICPLIHWTWEEVWMYIKFHGLPYNPLHDRGYPSIGCACCTTAASANGDLRSGRWAVKNKTECGLHVYEG
jgi:phosphoadenosine phosphosulfate reductase